MQRLHSARHRDWAQAGHRGQKEACGALADSVIQRQPAPNGGFEHGIDALVTQIALTVYSIRPRRRQKTRG
jgi:hypothetical protein